MKDLALRLHATRLFAHISVPVLTALLEESGRGTGAAGAEIRASGSDIVVLVDGGIVMTSHDGGAHLAALRIEPGARDPGILYHIPAGAKVTLSLPSTFVVLAGEAIDTALSQSHDTGELASLDVAVRARVEWMRHAQPFRQMPLDEIARAAAAMTALEVAAGEDVVRAREKGEYFYAIEQGRAEVWRPDTGTDDVRLVAILGPGSTFGEEALLQEGYRNATVRMMTAGRLLQLAKGDFDRLVRSHLVHELGPEEAMARLSRKGSDLIDCRYEAEYELWRIPGSRLMPLDTLRERARGLDMKREYLVYCRSGRRSRAAAFLLRQSGLNAFSIRGGISEWPFEIEGAAVGA